MLVLLLMSALLWASAVGSPADVATRTATVGAGQCQWFDWTYGGANPLALTCQYRVVGGDPDGAKVRSAFAFAASLPYCAVSRYFCIRDRFENLTATVAHALDYDPPYGSYATYGIMCAVCAGAQPVSVEFAMSLTEDTSLTRREVGIIVIGAVSGALLFVVLPLRYWIRRRRRGAVLASVPATVVVAPSA